MKYIFFSNFFVATAIGLFFGLNFVLQYKTIIFNFFFLNENTKKSRRQL